MKTGFRRDLLLAMLGFAFGSLLVVAKAGLDPNEDSLTRRAVERPV